MLKDSDIQTIRQSIPMKDVAQFYGYKINRQGFIRCPFHENDTHPSLKIYDGTRGYYCFVCNNGGDVIDFVRKHDGLEFEPAVRRLAEIFQVPISDGTSELSEADKKRIRSQIEAREAAERKKKEVEERLHTLSYDILICQEWQRHFRPLGNVWCGFQALIDREKADWEYWWGKVKEREKKT